jgi:hypothetical protein
MESLYISLHLEPSLRLSALIVGCILLAGHAWALASPSAASTALRRFPRSRVAGIALMALAGAWSYFHLSYMHMGEFFTWRAKLQLVTLVGTPLMCLYVKEFLAVRALGANLLLAAGILLSSAFLKDPWMLKLPVPLLAYAWIVAALFWVGMPWLLRDQIAWLTSYPSRLRIAAAIGLVYGVFLILGGLLIYPD